VCAIIVANIYPAYFTVGFHIFCLPVANWDGSTQLPTTWTAGTGMAGAESVEVVGNGPMEIK
jgi:hypothetical protein